MFTYILILLLIINFITSYTNLNITKKQHPIKRLCYALYNQQLLYPCNTTYLNLCLLNKLSQLSENEIQKFDKSSKSKCTTSFLCNHNINIELLKKKSFCKQSHNANATKTYLWGGN